MPTQDHQYHPKDALAAGVKGTAISGAAGLAVSAIQNTLTKRNIGAWGVLTRSGGTIAVFATMGGTYEFSRFASANLREKDDTYNTAIGGFLAGSVLGLKFGTIPAIVGYGALTSIVLAAYDYTGAGLTGYQKDQEADEFERKQALRKNRRRPIEETLSELGEGRGIYGPGYEERRRERLKEKYGYEIPAKS